MADLWQHDEPIIDLDDAPEVPPWISQDITPADVAAIIQGGCASGAYMPAVTYHEAQATMNEHGDAVLQYLEDYGTLEVMDIEEAASGSWAGIAVYFLSVAVEEWARSVEGELEDLLLEIEAEQAARSTA